MIAHPKADDWHSACRDRALAVAHAIAQIRRCDALQAELQAASPASIAVAGMNIALSLRHGARPMTANDFFAMAVSEGWCTRPEIEKEIA